MAGVQPSKFYNYISEWKKIFVTRNNGTITQKFKLDSNITDEYYFSIVNSRNQLLDLTGRKFKIYGSLIDAKNVMHILFYSDDCTLEEQNTVMHFHINTYTSEYMEQVKNTKIIDLTIIEVDPTEENELPGEGQPDIDKDFTQVILRDEAIAYKRPYLEYQMPAEFFEKIIYSGNVPLTGEFGAGQDISLTIGSNGAAFGTGLIQTGNDQLVIGSFNEVDNTKVFVIGNGQNDTERSNVFTVDYNGNLEANAISAASLYIGGVQIGSDLNQKFEATSAWALDTFALKGEVPNISAGVGINVNVVDGVTWITNTGGSSGTGDKTYLNGTGLGLSTVSAEDAIYKFYVNTEWLSTTIDAQVSGQFDDLSIQVSANEEKIETISGTFNDYTKTVDLADYISDNILTGYATTGWVEEKQYATTGVVDTASTTIIDSLTAYALSTNVYSKAEVDDVVTSAVNDLATGAVATNTTDIGLVDGRVQAIEADYTTSAQVSSIITSYNYITSAEIPDTYVQQDTLTAYATKEALDELSGATSGLSNRVEALETVSSSFALAENVYSKSVADETFATKGEIPTVSDLSAGMYEAISGDVEAQITGKNYITSDALTGLATEADLQYVSGVVSAQSADITALKAVSGQVDYETVFDMLSSSDTDTLTITKDDQNEKIVFTAAGGSGGDKTYHGDGGIEVNNVTDTISISANFLSANALEGYATQSWVGEQGYLTQVPNTYALKTDVDTASGAAVTAATGWVNSQNYLTEVPSEYVTETELSEEGFLKDIPTSYVQRTELSAYATSSWVDENYAKKGEAPTDVYTKTEVNAISTALSTTVSEAGYLTSVPDIVSAAAVEAATGWVNEQGYLTEVPNTYALKTDIPTTVAELTDASDYALVANLPTSYISSSDVSGIVEDMSGAIRTGLATTDSISDMATQTWVGQQGFALTSQLPTDYTTSAQVSAIASAYVSEGGITSAQVSAIITGYNYATQTDLQTTSAAITGWVEEQGYGTGSAISAVGQLINDVGYITEDNLSSYTTSGQVSSIVEGYNYATQADLQTTSSTITAQIPDDAHISAIASGYAGGGGATYLAGTGLALDDNTNTFSLTGTVLSGDGSTVEINNNVISAKEQYTNKQQVTTGFVYDPTKAIYKNEYTPVDGVITLNAFSVDRSLLGNDVATFEEWIYTSSAITGVNVDLFLNLVGQLPSSFTEGYYYVFTRRINSNGNQFVSFAYECKNTDYSELPLTFLSRGNTSVTLSSIGSPDSVTMYYSKNGGEWTAYTINDSISLTDNETVAFSGTTQTLSKAKNNYYKFVTAGDGRIRTYGNCNSLINNTNSLANYIFYALFSGCINIFDNSYMTLPATSLASNCYNSMFAGCTNLIRTVVLPATTFSDSCYCGMFKDCINLNGIDNILTPSSVNIPSLTYSCLSAMFAGCTSITKSFDMPEFTYNGGQNLGQNFYNSMFSGCTSLTAVPKTIKLFNSKANLYQAQKMFAGCTSLSTVPKGLLPNSTIYASCYQQMFSGCTSLTSAPDLPATTLAQSCYQEMFARCSALIAAPELPATTLAKYCYSSMFYKCTSLSSISVAFTDWSQGPYPTGDWVKGVAANGQFICPTALGTNQTITRGTSNCPNNWTVINK